MRDLDALPLSPKQIRSIAQSKRSRISCWSGAVRSGKTIASLVAFLIALAEAPTSGIVVIAGRTLQTIERNLIEPLQDPALFGEIAKLVVHTRGSTTATILGRTVHLIGAADARAEGRLRGLTACLAMIDEATLVPESFFQQMLARLSVPGARLLITTNPDGPAHWLRRKFILRADDLDLAHWHFTLDDNPSLDPRYVAALKAEYVGLWYRRFILGQWILAEGAIFDMWDEERHVETTVPTITRWVGTGCDYGTVNPFVGLVGGLGTDRRLHLVAEYRYDSRLNRRQKTDAEYSTALQDFHASVELPGTTLRGVRPEYVCVDPSAASFVTQLFRDSVPGVTLADNAVLDGIRMMATLLGNDRLRVHRSCKGFLEEVGSYAWDDAAAEKGEDKPIKVDDHSVDAARYLIKTTEPLWYGTLRQPLQEAA